MAKQKPTDVTQATQPATAVPTASAAGVGTTVVSPVTEVIASTPNDYPAFQTLCKAADALILAAGKRLGMTAPEVVALKNALAAFSALRGGV